MVFQLLLGSFMFIMSYQHGHIYKTYKLVPVSLSCLFLGYKRQSFAQLFIHVHYMSVPCGTPFFSADFNHCYLQLYAIVYNSNRVLGTRSGM